MLLRRLKISLRILMKLTQKHQVSYEEIEQCFLNCTKGFLEDIRACNLTEPPTLWFIAETDICRQLKVVFIAYDNGTYEIKTVYQPNLNEVKIYEKYA